MTEKLLLRVLQGEPVTRVPVWLMRQAGRYLPEYRATRSQAGSFLDLCFNPELAEEVTLQPIRRYGFDGAILFSDILIVPFGLGQPVRFEEGKGPILEPIEDASGLSRLDFESFELKVSGIYETVRRVRSSLPQETTLIGFAGAPWTVATYMIEGGSSKNFAKTKAFAYRDPAGFSQLIDILVEATGQYLFGQIEAGADCVKLFDSWAGALSESHFESIVIEPTRRLVTMLHEKYPDVPVIGFPRGAGANYTEFVARTGVDAVAIDTNVPLAWASEHLQTRLPLQGNLDPIALIAGGDALDTEVDRILEGLANGPHIFNLGHGILPSTPLENVERLVRRIRDHRS